MKKKKTTNDDYVKARKRLLNHESGLIRDRADVNYRLIEIRKRLKEWDQWLTG